MKRVWIIVMSWALMLGATQCKKEIKEEIPYDNKAVNIGLRPVNGGNRLYIDSETGEVEFDYTDEIIVVSNGLYVGRLWYDADAEAFYGTIMDPSPDDYLHFYYLGNMGLYDLDEYSDCVTVDISNQINGLPLISYGHSTEKYSEDIEYYEAVLENKCALAKFDVSLATESSSSICVTGMNNTVFIDFAQASFDYYMENDGKIMLPSGNYAHWAIVFPQQALSEGPVGSAYAGRCVGRRSAVPEIVVNAYVDNIRLDMDAIRQPEGALNGAFTVNGSGKQVVFSKGNLSYSRISCDWNFLDNQYSFIENRHNMNIGRNCSNLSTISLFAFGQSGYDHGAASFRPYETYTQQAYFNAYSGYHLNLYNYSGKADWGYNAICNGGNTNKQWRTLQGNEWNYIFTGRDGADEKYAKATVCGIMGVVVLPDEWIAPYDGCFTYGDDVVFDDNDYSESDWALMEDAGAIFLPMAGYRYGEWAYGANMTGRYWSSSVSDKYSAYGVYINQDGTFNPHYNLQRNAGMSVRLVTD